MHAGFQMPIVDLNQAENDPIGFAREVRSAMERAGFLAVTNHGISLGLLARCKEVTEALLSRPESDFGPELRHPELQRGYCPRGSEKGVRGKYPDDKVFEMIRDEQHPENPDDNPYGPNLWPDELESEFRPIMLELFKEEKRIGLALLQALEIAYELPKGRLTDMTFGAETILRAIRYPPVADNAPEGLMRSEEHEDINLITVLPSTSRGLELQLDGVWYPAGTDPDLVLVNIGEMIAEVAGIHGSLTATTHRVRLPEGEARTLSRCAWPLFIHARHSVELRPGLLAGPWFKKRIAEINATLA